MPLKTLFIIAAFKAPEPLATNPKLMLWLLPLAAAIAVIYKATKMPKITAVAFFKETVLLFGSIVVFIIVTALVLFAVVWLMAL